MIDWHNDHDVPAYAGRVFAGYSAELHFDVTDECKICIGAEDLGSVEVWDPLSEEWISYHGPACLENGLYRWDRLFEADGIELTVSWDPITQTIGPNIVPEPSSGMFSLVGVVGLLTSRRRPNKR